MMKFSKGAIEGSLPLLATRYSKKFGVTIRIQGTTAYTTGKAITIPRIDLGDPMKVRFSYAYLAHESAHVKYTNLGFWQQRKVQERSEFERSILNVLEDARVERLISRRYIGVFENLQYLRNYAEDWEKFKQDIVKKEAKESGILLSYMIEFLVVHCQEFFTQTDKIDFLKGVLSANYPPEMFDKLDSLLNQVKDCKGIEEAYEVSRKIYKLIANEVESKQPEKENSKENQDENQEQDQQKSSGGNQGAGQGTGKNKSAAMNKLSKEIDECDSVCPGLDFSKKLAGMADNSGARNDFGSMGVDKVTPGRDLTSECKEYMKIRTILREKVKAWCDFQRNNTSQRGRYLNVLKAQNIRFGESRVFFTKGEEEDYSTSIHLLVDCSSSMMTSDGGDRSRARLASLSALNLALALDGIDGVKLMVSFFPGRAGEVENCLDYTERVKKKVRYFDQCPRGSTPLAQAILHAITKVEEVQCNRNMIIVITDGMSDSVSNTKNAVAICDKSGIEIYGIGIKTDNIKDFLSRDKMRVIEDTKELPSVCANIVSGLFEVSKKDRLSVQ